MLALLYRAILRPLLFLLPAETAHHVGAWYLRALHLVPLLRRLCAAPAPDPRLAVEALGLRFASPVGLAAGFDKQGRLYRGLHALGFGAVEIGTVTALPQPGNPRPRLFRLPADRALVNRMGFNNPGAIAVAEAVRAHPVAGTGQVLGINLGKSKVTPIEEAADDYAASARRLAPLADYLVINVSSPNTPGLRSLQSVEALRPIIAAVQAEIAAAARRVPLLVKIAPDLADEDVDAVADLALAVGLDGLIATNTTIGRAGLRSEASVVEAIGAGGLSGPPVRARALAVLRRLRARSGGRLLLIGVGGIETADDAWEMLRAGATLVQVYTGFVYGGPGLPRAILEGLARRLDESGLPSIAALTAREHEAPAA